MFDLCCLLPVSSVLKTSDYAASFAQAQPAAEQKAPGKSAWRFRSVAVGLRGDQRVELADFKARGV